MNYSNAPLHIQTTSFRSSPVPNTPARFTTEQKPTKTVRFSNGFVPHERPHIILASVEFYARISRTKNGRANDVRFGNNATPSGVPDQCGRLVRELTLTAGPCRPLGSEPTRQTPRGEPTRNSRTGFLTGHPPKKGGAGWPPLFMLESCGIATRSSNADRSGIGGTNPRR